jgi:hypothetical protein
MLVSLQAACATAAATPSRSSPEACHIYNNWRYTIVCTHCALLHLWHSLRATQQVLRWLIGLGFGVSGRGWLQVTQQTACTPYSVWWLLPCVILML